MHGRRDGSGTAQGPGATHDCVGSIWLWQIRPGTVAQVRHVPQDRHRAAVIPDLAVPAGSGRAAERLEELEELLRRGLLTEEE